jgi:integrase
MARRLRSPTLETRSARLKLKVRRKPYFISVGRGLSLGYRRNLNGGTWLVRCADGRGGAWTQVFARSDDFEDASGSQVIDFWTAQKRCLELVRGKATDASKPVLVKAALEEYGRDLVIRGGGIAQVNRVRKQLTPVLLARPVGSLVMRELRNWRDAQLATGLAPGSVSRSCRTLKACFNFAAAQDPSIANKQAWTIGLASLPDSHVARTDAVLSDDVVRAVVAACYAASPRLGLFFEVLAVTGCRPVQAARLLVGDVQTDRVMMPRSAKGKGKKRIDRRSVPLPPGLIDKLKIAAGNRPADAPLLQRPDGEAWRPGNSGHIRPFTAALAAAGLRKVIPYALRHTSITRALLRGVPVRVVADLHDTSIEMIERNYASCLATYGDAMVRAAQIELAPEAVSSVVTPLARHRP